ncbi:MAG: glycosyltransferase [Calditrichaceae bacterium]
MKTDAMSGKVTLIITVYNRSHFLRSALLALRSQSFKIDELIISDDGSSEDIISVIKESLSGLDCAVKFVRQDDKGFRLAKCRNNAIREAEGDQLIFIDQDIVYTKNYLKTFTDNQEKGVFLVAYPVRLREDQTNQLTEKMIEDADYSSLISPEQRKKIHKQYYSDLFEYYLKKTLRTKGHKPKLRGGVFAIGKEDILKVDGFDENYQGWGNEDDDLGRRLYKARIIGKNVFYDDYPIHLYHPTFHVDGKRVNQEYYQTRIKEIRNGKYRAVHGVSNPLGDEKIEVIRLR